jgi:hypothetical protein
LGLEDAFSLLLEQFLRKRHERKGPLKLHFLSLHKLKLQNDLKCRESMRIKKDRKSKLSGKEKSNGTWSAPFCDGKYNSKNNETLKDTKKKEKRMDVSKILKRSKAVGVIHMCKSTDITAVLESLKSMTTRIKYWLYLHLSYSLQKFRQNIREGFHYKHSSRQQMLLLADMLFFQNVSMYVS